MTCPLPPPFMGGPEYRFGFAGRVWKLGSVASWTDSRGSWNVNCDWNEGSGGKLLIFGVPFDPENASEKGGNTFVKGVSVVGLLSFPVLVEEIPFSGGVGVPDPLILTSVAPPLEVEVGLWWCVGVVGFPPPPPPSPGPGFSQGL